MRKHLLPGLDRFPKLGNLRLPTIQLPTPKLSLPRPGGAGRNGGRLELTEVRGHLAFTASTVTAWYVVPERVWPFQSDGSREALLTQIATQYAHLDGAHLHLRRTSTPFPIDRWARALEGNAAPLPVAGAADATTWGQHLDNARRRLADGEYTLSRTHLGVTFPRPGRLLRATKRGGGDALDEGLAKRIFQVTEELAATGLAARPATARELAWLIFRSIGVGLTPPTHRPGNVGADDIAEFVENVDVERGRYSATTQLTDRRTGQSVHVAVLTVGRMEPLEIPQVHDPWAHLSDQFDFPVEWSSRVQVLGPAASRGTLERRLLMIRSQQRDYADHNLPEPPELERLALRASQVGDDIDTGLPLDSSRVHGYHRMAVYADTAELCLEQVRAVARRYDQDLHATVVHPKCQYELLREFTPGAPVADTGYIRRMPVRLFAAAMPQATAAVGDNRGDLIGHTALGGERPVFYDPHYATEVREKSGLAVFVAEPGGGKSTLLGALGYLAARRGVQVTLMDPSGPLAELCRMPELAPYARVIDLVGSQRGTLAPYALVPTPRRTEFPLNETGERAHKDAVAMAEAERRALVLDIAKMLLPSQVADDAGVEVALREALRHVPAEDTATLDDVVDTLDELGNEGNVSAKTAAGLLTDAAQMPLAKLFFGNPPPDVMNADAPLTVITMGGLQLPDLSVARQYWSTEESLAVPMLHTAHRLAVRRCYTGNRNVRKFVGLDEAHFMSGWGSGRSFLIRLARDSRKWNIAAMVASQNPADILGMDVQNLVSTVFVGRIADDRRVAEDALRMLRVPTGVGYEQVLAGLSQHADAASSDRLGYREFVMRDVDGRVQKIRVDVAYVAGLLAALDTTPGGAR